MAFPAPQEDINMIDNAPAQESDVPIKRENEEGEQAGFVGQEEQQPVIESEEEDDEPRRVRKQPLRHSRGRLVIQPRASAVGIGHFLRGIDLSRAIEYEMRRDIPVSIRSVHHDDDESLPAHTLTLIACNCGREMLIQSEEHARSIRDPANPRRLRFIVPRPGRAVGVRAVLMRNFAAVRRGYGAARGLSDRFDLVEITQFCPNIGANKRVWGVSLRDSYDVPREGCCLRRNRP